MISVGNPLGIKGGDSIREYVPKDWRCDRYRWYEMVNFCRQYDNLRREANDILLEYRAASGVGGGGSSSPSDPTATRAERLAKVQTKIELIEYCCQRATKDKPELYRYLLTSVTSKISYEHLAVPLSKRRFMERRKIFFYLLNQKL